MITYRDDDAPELEFRWHGGPYVDICLGDEALDVLNVWDDVNDRSEFESDALDLNGTGEPHWRPFRFILERFEDRCRQWLCDGYEDDEGRE